MSRVVYQNGKLIPEKEAGISIYDSAMMFGDMVFEMTRSFNKKQFKLREHLVRLYKGIKILRIPLQMTIEEMEQACFKTVEANEPFFEHHDEHRLMINVSRGLLSIYAPVFDNKIEPTVIIADFPLKWTVSGMRRLFDTGINAVIPAQRVIPASLLDPKIKNRSRLHYQMANIEVSGYEGENNWALMLDPDGYIAEGTGANFFIVTNNTIITPEGRNVLRGISSDYVFEVSNQLGLECIEKNIEPYDVYSADEAFISATPFCMLPVVSLNQIKIGNGKVGKIFNKLLDTWSNNVGINIKKQIKSWNKNTKLKVSPYVFKK